MLYPRTFERIWIAILETKTEDWMPPHWLTNTRGTLDLIHVCVNLWPLRVDVAKDGDLKCLNYTRNLHCWITQ